MSQNREYEATVARWDQLFQTLSSKPRRQLVHSLMTAPRGARLPLPEAAMTDPAAADPITLSIELRHTHLPKLAEQGYVRWSTDPFVCQRGANFDEPARVLEILIDSSDELPASLWNESIDRTVDEV